MSAGTRGRLFDPFDPDAASDPYPAYARLRSDAPVHYVEELELWTVARYDDVVSVLRQPKLFSSALGMGDLLRGGVGRRRERPPQYVLDLAGLRVLIATDPPDHTQLRRLVGNAFTPREVAALEPRIRRLADEMVTALIEQGEGADLATSLAAPLPVIVIAELLGIPAERREDFKRWSDDMVGGLSGSWEEQRALGSGQEMFAFFMDAVEERRRRPGTDLISLLVTRGVEGDAALTAMEIVLFCVLLLIAGNETTTNLITNGVNAFFEHPAEAAKLWAEPTLAPQVVEEVLRYDAPVQGLFRMTTAPTELDGTALPERARLMVLFGSANRDGSRFPAADQFSVERAQADHVAFGSGIHLCLGAPLARLEARVTFETLVSRLEGIEPAGPCERVDSVVLRGFSRMPVTVTPR